MQEINVNSHISQWIKKSIDCDLVYYTAETLKPQKIVPHVNLQQTKLIIQKILTIFLSLQLVQNCTKISCGSFKKNHQLTLIVITAPYTSVRLLAWKPDKQALE